MSLSGVLAPAGTLTTKVIRGVPNRQLTLAETIYFSMPHMGLTKEVLNYRFKNMPNIWRGLRRIALAQRLGIPTLYGQLSLVKIDGRTGRRTNYGIVSLRVVTNNGVGYIVDSFENLVEPENMKYHGLGTGTTAEAAADSALVTELTTEYNPNSTRATGTTTESSANIYVTVATNTLDSGTPAVTEHGIFSAASAGVLLDRSVFSAINLVGANGDGIQSTYSLTFTSGG